jgi:hypothetical protein
MQEGEAKISQTIQKFPNGGHGIEVPKRRSLNGGHHLFGGCGLGINVSHACLTIWNFGVLIRFPNLAQKCKE